MRENVILIYEKGYALHSNNEFDKIEGVRSVTSDLQLYLVYN